ncbi:hypothetical protein C7S18_11690 [Ahniella affigens]|uniref:Uncharacterized protein n=1 Tax=Ahniella affigens TaxID=2021234 RepID=A0A2P1PQ76_9GAMM|nr:hypothetical protein [Ahniella affigens]AVP96990.1 hypothetical protein C7S18_07170 [Ahniella affigens]AVP97818.1 hypothetical protein C7S18_11690 [Ahniella affigens]
MKHILCFTRAARGPSLQQSLAIEMPAPRWVVSARRRERAVASATAANGNAALASQIKPGLDQ